MSAVAVRTPLPLILDPWIRRPWRRGREEGSVPGLQRRDRLPAQARGELHLRGHDPPLHEVGLAVPGRDERDRLLRQARRRGRARFRPSSSISTRASSPGRHSRARTSIRSTRSSSTRRWRCTCCARSRIRCGRCGSSATTTSTSAASRSTGRPSSRLIDFIRALAAKKDGGEQPTVNIIAHSMGGLIVREAIQRAYPERGERAADHINKVVTLGTPHQGISFTLLKEWIKIDAADELKHFDPEFQKRRERRHRVRSLQRVLPARTAADGGRNELPHVWQRCRRRRSIASSRSLVREGRATTEATGSSSRRSRRSRAARERSCTSATADRTRS